VLGNLALIQRDDGKLADGCITVDSMSAELLEEITPRDGIDGQNAANPNFTVQAHTVAPGGAATVNVTGAYPNLTIDFGLPRGNPAAPGEATLPDGDYGDVVLSLVGTHMKVETVLDGQTPATAGDIAALTAAVNAKVPSVGGAITGNLNIGGTLGVTGNVTLAGTIGLVGDATLSGNVNIALNNKALRFKDTEGGTPLFVCQADDNFVFYGTNAAGAQAGIWSCTMHSDTAPVIYTRFVQAPTPAPGDNSTKLATTAFVLASLAGFQPAGSYATTAQLAAKADAFTFVDAFNFDLVFSDDHNGRYIRFTGATPRTATFGNLSSGLALILANRSTRT
jgi:hypothetical protein